MKSTALLCLVVFLLGPCFVAATSASHSLERWGTSWVSAQHLVEPHNMPPNPGLTGRTLRQIIQPSLSGTRLRITISNTFGDAPLTVRSAAVARSQGADAIDPSSHTHILFSGNRSIVLQPGTSIVSDATDFTVTAFQNLAVSLELGEVPARLTGHPGSRTTSFIASDSVAAAATLPNAVRVERWYLVSALDVQTNQDTSAILVLGDSITDGRGSTTDENNRWPNILARRLHGQSPTRPIAVLNQGVGGGRLLRDGNGVSALGRFDRDVLGPIGVRWLIVFIGVNDIGSAVGARAKGQPAASAEDVIAGYRQLIYRARNHGMKVIGATIMPFRGFQMYDKPESEADRQTVNAWIRSSGEFDAVIDFDAVTRDSEDPAKLASAVDGGDHLHPSAEGYRIMGEAIDLNLFHVARE